MAWDCTKFRDNMEKYNSAYHGGEGSIGFYELKGYSTIDIDQEEDFLIAESISEALKKSTLSPEYYESPTLRDIEEITHDEVDVESK